MPFRVEDVGTVASPNLPARKGVPALRHAQPTQIISGSGLSSPSDSSVANTEARLDSLQHREDVRYA